MINFSAAYPNHTIKEFEPFTIAFKPLTVTETLRLSSMFTTMVLPGIEKAQAVAIQKQAQEEHFRSQAMRDLLVMESEFIQTPGLRESFMENHSNQVQSEGSEEGKEPESASFLSQGAIQAGMMNMVKDANIASILEMMALVFNGAVLADHADHTKISQFTNITHWADTVFQPYGFGWFIAAGVVGLEANLANFSKSAVTCLQDAATRLLTSPIMGNS